MKKRMESLFRYNHCNDAPAAHVKQLHLVMQVLLLDELTTFLDSADQQGVLKAVKGLVAPQGSESVTALWVSMFLHLATDTCALVVHLCL